MNRPRPIPPAIHAVTPVLARLCGAAPDDWQPVDEGAYSPAGRWLVRWRDGRSAFVKAESRWSEGRGTGMEHAVYSAVDARCVPRLIAYEPGVAGATPRVLVTEDLSVARWGIPLTRADAEALSDALHELATVTPPSGLKGIPLRPEWSAICAAPQPALQTGLFDAAWLERYGAELARAEAEPQTDGAQLVHLDLWLQNWCRADRGAVLVDWAGSALGNVMVSRTWGEAGIRAAGGPRGCVVGPGHAEWAVWMAGQATAFLAEGPRGAPAALLQTMRREAIACLAWACEELGMPAPAPAPGIVPSGPWRP